MRKKLTYIVCCILLSGFSAWAQSVEDTKMNTQPWGKLFMEQLDVGGYYRFYYNDRIFDSPYDDLGVERQIAVLEPSYYDPMLFLYLGGKPTPNSSFGVELRLDNTMLGASRNPGLGIGIFNALVLRGNTSTKKAGDYDIRFGGIEWENMTPFTFGQNTAFDRYSIFERRPWDPGENVIKRPADYYYSGVINQDTRFGTNAFKGFLVNVTKLPKNLSAKVLYGNSQNLSGFDREAQVTPKRLYGAKLEKTLEDKRGNVGVSTYNTVSYTDSILRAYDTRRVFRMLETYATLKFENVGSIFAEIGYATNQEPLVEKHNATAFLIDIKTDKAFSFIPLKLRMYRFEKYFVNLDSYIGNTTTTPYLQNLASQNPGANLPNSARLTNPGDLMNNRVGGNVSADFNIKGLKLTTSLELGKDVERFSETNTLTYGHRINGYEISMLPFLFPNPLGNFGPNQRMNSSYRGAYEIVMISDTAVDGGIKDKLTYTSIDIQAKYKVRIGKNDLYLFNLNTFSAVNNKPFYDGAFISASYHEFEAYYKVWRDISLALYHGFERIKGNEFTDQELQEDGTLAARDQTGKSWGIGVDYQLNDKAFLYLRQRWFQFDDKNFVGENFDGTRLSVELKVFF